MTNEEAIEILRYSVCPDSTGRDCGKYTCVECAEGHRMAIEALEKRIPKKPGYVGHGHYICIKCHMRIDESENYCRSCGQAIDWTREVGE